MNKKILWLLSALGVSSIIGAMIIKNHYNTGCTTCPDSNNTTEHTASSTISTSTISSDEHSNNDKATDVVSSSVDKENQDSTKKCTTKKCKSPKANKAIKPTSKGKATIGKRVKKVL